MNADESKTAQLPDDVIFLIRAVSGVDLAQIKSDEHLRQMFPDYDVDDQVDKAMTFVGVDSGYVRSSLISSQLLEMYAETLFRKYIRP